MATDSLVNDIMARFDAADFEQYIESIKSELTYVKLSQLTRAVLTESSKSPSRGQVFIRNLQRIADILGTYDSWRLVNWTHAMLLTNLQFFNEAIEIYDRLEQRVKPTGNKLHIAGIQTNRASLYRSTGRHTDALYDLNEARILCEEIGEEALQYRVFLERQASMTYWKLGDPKTGLDVCETGLQLALELNLPNHIGWLMNAKALLLTELDRFDEAEKLFQRSLDIFIDHEYHAEVARLHMNLGSLYARQGKYLQALRHLDKSIQLNQVQKLNSNIALANYTKSIVHLKLGLYQEVLVDVDRTIEVLSTHNLQLYKTQALINKCVALYHLGETHAALGLIKEAYDSTNLLNAQLELHRINLLFAELLSTEYTSVSLNILNGLLGRITSSTHPTLATSIHLLIARLSIKRGTFENAKTHLTKAQELLKTCPVIESEIQLSYLKALLAENRFGPKPAYPLFQATIDSLNKMKNNLEFDEFAIGYMERQSHILKAFIRNVHTLVKSGTFSVDKLLQALIVISTAPFSKVPPVSPNTHLLSNDEIQLRKLQTEWQWLRSSSEDSPRFSFQESVQSDLNISKSSHNFHRIRALESEIATIIQRKRIQIIPSQESKQKDDISADRVSSTLNLNEAFIQYYVVDKNCYLLYVDRNSHLIIDLNIKEKKIENLIRAWYFHNGNASLYEPQAINLPLITFSKNLFDYLLSPIWHHILSKKHIFVALPPQWQNLPFAALHTAEQYLIEIVSITLVSCPKTLVDRRNIPTKHYLSNSIIISHSDSQRLSHTSVEAEHIVKTLTTVGKVHELHDADATSTYLLNNVREHTLVHFATHAAFRPDNPMFSFIRLSDRDLTVAEIYDIQFYNDPLIVLSACQTGLGVPKGGGLIGLGRGFLAAGASTLIMTLWQVEDEASAKLMMIFYDTLASQTTTIAAALQTAQISILRQNPHPVFWAGFVHSIG